MIKKHRSYSSKLKKTAEFLYLLGKRARLGIYAWVIYYPITIKNVANVNKYVCTIDQELDLLLDDSSGHKIKKHGSYSSK